MTSWAVIDVPVAVFPGGRCPRYRQCPTQPATPPMTKSRHHNNAMLSLEFISSGPPPLYREAMAVSTLS